jgi:hypothetical protein
VRGSATGKGGPPKSESKHRIIATNIQIKHLQKKSSKNLKDQMAILTGASAKPVSQSIKLVL